MRKKQAAASPDPSPGADHRPPGPLLMALELRAPWELWSVIPCWPLLMRAPAGDGHPVIVFPGLSAGDGSTLPLRAYLQNLGYDVSGWNQGTNFGPRAGIMDTAVRQLQDTAEATGEPVSLVGWSLGGIYARELAKLLPQQVRCVITMGTPFSGSHTSTNAWRLYELTRGRAISQEIGQFDLPSPPPVPTTSIFSRTDGVVAWQASLQQPSRAHPQTENIEVVASHLGLGMNPATWWAVADRLAQSPETWRPFERHNALERVVYPNPAR